MDDHCGALPPDGHNDEQCDTEQQGAEPRTGTGAQGLDHRTMNTTYSASVPSTSASQRR